MLKLSKIVSAFLGDVEAGAEVMGDALESAIIVMAKDGTRAPIDEACTLIGKLTGRTDREKAVQAGWKACGITTDAKGRSSVPGVAVGKMSPENSTSVAADVSAAFVAGVAEFLTTPRAPKKADPMASGARALANLDKLTDAQFGKLIGTTAGADLVARIARVQAAAVVADAARNARRAPAAAPAAAPSIA